MFNHQQQKVTRMIRHRDDCMVRLIDQQRILGGIVNHENLEIRRKAKELVRKHFRVVSRINCLHRGIINNTGR